MQPIMTPEDLKRTIDDTRLAVENYHSLSRAKVDVLTGDEALLTQAGQHLSNSLYLLLPPRGPASSSDCPHCGNSIKVTLTK